MFLNKCAELVPNMHISADSIIVYPKLGEQMDKVILTLMIYSYISFFHQWNEFLLTII